MDSKQPRPLLLQWCGGFLCAHWEENKLPFLSSILFGLLAYTFAFTNKLLNHDEAFSLFMKGATVDSGRWGLGFLDCVFPNISMPWIYGVITIVLIAVSICLILNMFAIRSKLLQVLLSGCIMVFPSLIGTFTYMFTSSSYAVSFLCAVLAVWILNRDPKRGAIPALGLMIFSLSIYQAYIAISAGLLILILINRLLRGENTASVVRSGIFYVAFLVVSLGLYYAATQIFLKLLHVEMNSYASESVSFSLLSIPANIVAAYKSFLKFFIKGSMGLMSTALSRVLHIFCAAATFLLLIIWLISQEKRELPRYLLLFILLALLPLAINCMYLFTSEDAIHTLVVYSFISVYILAVMVSDLCLPIILEGRWQTHLRSVLLNIVTLSMAVVILINIYVANAVYLKLYLQYENTYSFYSTLLTQVQSMPEFTKDTKLSICGWYNNSEYYQSHNYLQEKFSMTNGIAGASGIHIDSYSRRAFMEYYLGFSIPAPTSEEKEAIIASPEFAQMPIYPYYGSIRVFGDTIVVKLSDIPE